MSTGVPSSSLGNLTAEQQQLYEQISEQMRVDGTREALKNNLKDRLIEANWKKELMQHCQQMIFDKGLANVTVDDLVMSTQDKASEKIPQKVKEDMLQYIRATLIERAEKSS